MATSKYWSLSGLMLTLAAAITPFEATWSQDAGFGVEEIIVTAQKRAESLQDVPISIVAVSAAALEKSGVTTLDALQRLAPGLTISAVGSGFVSYTYIRGGGTNQIDTGSDPSVAYFVDEVYVGGTAGLQFDLFDIERVEVLKGPQGTLFGRNAAVGAISVTTKRPSPDFGATADIQGGKYGDFALRGSATGPLSGNDNLSYRLSAGYKRRDAYTDNLAGTGDPGDVDSLGGRAQLQYEDDGLTVLLSADGLRARNGMTNQFISTANKSGLVSAAVIPTLPTNESFYRHYYNAVGHEDQDAASLTGRIEAETAIGTFTSISAYRRNTFDRVQDQDATLAPSFLLTSKEKDKTFSQEFRLAGEGEAYRWLTGLYYYHGRVDQNFLVNAGPAFPTAVVQNTFATDVGRITANSYAAFAQFTYDFTDDLALTLGGRYTKDKKRNVRSVKGFLAPAPFTVTPRDTWESFDPAVTLTFDISPDVMAYASYRQGYKSGGFQALLVATPALASTPFSPEKVDSYEVGFKSSALDRRFTLDSALFWTDITNQQILRITGTAVQTIDNAGATRTKGVDLSMALMPAPELRLDASMTYQEARFRVYQNGTVSYAGNAQLRSPDFTGAFSAEYTVALANQAELIWRAEYTRQSRVYFDAANTQVVGIFQPGFGLLNGRITYQPQNADWSVSAWAKNLGGTTYYRNVAPSGLTGLAVPGDPFTFGLSARVSLD
ncbi:MAG: TonB-dependent receptor [Rhodospirillaceae bacterium]|nr:TonB-dependent receptor [Rhodospirillaceae bacterium]